MKSDLDLTEYNDFNSNKFLPAKVKRNYYDLDNYARRVPWSKDGEVLSSAKFINFTPDWDYLSSTTTYDLDNNLFITNTDPDISNGLMLMHNTSNVSSMRAWISNQTTLNILIYIQKMMVIDIYGILVVVIKFRLVKLQI